jgi:hypothetical protein
MEITIRRFACLTFGLMQRWTGVLMLSLFVGLLLAPLAVLLEFQIHRDSIERELCVQRDVMESMRTCHGECQLAKRFKALEQESETEFPSDRIEVRLEPRVPISENVAELRRDASDRVFPCFEAHELVRAVSVPEQVPRV